ncbi:unnamed protein product [Arabis nemorensis]|uniref:HTH myb-type domain-containing protein n=1 Tax=Arabis nemorensis TaxID=586526 RepID=A0A565BR23_9BRAS|nr:unnamed protein product [Arabis nemorensis]
MRTAAGIWKWLVATGNTHGLSATQVHDHLKRMMKIEKAAQEGDEVEAQEGQVEAQEGDEV